MIVDDRLETVLRTDVAGRAGLRTQYRQLADLLDRTPSGRWSGVHDAALERLDSLHDALGSDGDGPEVLRGCRFRSVRLVEHFAARGGRTAAAAIGAARLTEAEWIALIPGLPVQARGFLRHRRDLGSAVEALLSRLGIEDFALPEPTGYVRPALAVVVPAEPVPDAAERAETGDSPADPAASGIGAIVRRIEAFRRQREGAPNQGVTESGQAPLPFADLAEIVPGPVLTGVDLRIDADGMIAAASGIEAAGLIGHRPFTGESDAPAGCDAATLRAVRSRLPVSAGLVTIEGAERIAGRWRIDAVPRFAAGRFTGYDARLRRPRPAPEAAAANDDAADSNADRLRQLLHELRTPINAIQGFAELIQQQMLGPTPHQYRSLAAGIASDAARMLAGFEDIERLVRLEAGRHERAELEPAGTTDLAGLLHRLVGQLEPVTSPREVKLRCRFGDEAMPVAMPVEEAERTLWRLLSVIAAAAAPGERLTLALAAGAGFARLSLPLPAALAMRDDAALFAPDGGRSTGTLPGGAMLGTGFALRLAAAEVRAAGGAFARSGARIAVDLPLLTEARQAHSPAMPAAKRAD